MQVGSVLHSSRLDTLAQSIIQGEARAEALERFNTDVRNDTKAWLLEGIPDFYIGLPKKLVVRSFKNALREKEADGVIDFLETMHGKIQEGLFPKRLR